MSLVETTAMTAAILTMQEQGIIKVVSPVFGQVLSPVFPVPKPDGSAPDPEASKIDAFAHFWSDFSYAFSPFSVISKVPWKVHQDKATILLLMPLWMTQPWFPRLLESLIATPVWFPAKDLLRLEHSPQEKPRLNDQLVLLGCKISGNPMLPKVFRKTLQSSSWTGGGQTLSPRTQREFEVEKLSGFTTDYCD
uniref:Uncharacterized protein n=1 Tax=Strigamia maritima TaxID=126957 RepID=T1JES1_STRMM